MNNAFEVTQQQTAVLSVWKSTEAKQATQGVLYTRKRADGTNTVLGTVKSSNNLQYKGHSIPSDKMVDVPVELRITPEQFEELVDIVGDFPGRLFEVAVNVTAISMKVLTANGVPTNSVTFHGEVLDVREVAAQLNGDTFGTKEDMFAFLDTARDTAIQKRDAARDLMQAAANAAKPQQGESVVNALG